MDFFKTVFTDEPDPSDLTETDTSQSQSPKHSVDTDQESTSNPNPSPKSQDSSASAWSFGGLIKTFQSKSETVIQTYRRDLEEFGTGLKKETAAIREAASRAVKELPASIEVAQESIESVWRGTAEIISQSKDSILSGDIETDQNFRNSKKYNRFDTQILAIQSDLSTFTEEPDDLEDFGKWKLGFVLEGKNEEIENLLGENGVMEGIYEKIVPGVIDHEMFWSRYFYKVYKLKQVEDARANLVKRAISGEEEDLSWDVDDDDNTSVYESKGILMKIPEKDESSELEMEKKNTEEPEVDGEIENESPVVESVSSDNKKASLVEEKASLVEEKASLVEASLEEKADVSTEELEIKSDEEMLEKEKVDPSEMAKDSVISVVSSQPSEPEEEDLGWDEIEDLGSSDEKKVTTSGSPNRSDLRKRLSAADEDEDLNWDIEDDEEPVKH